MGYTPGETLIEIFPTSSSSGALANADSLPTASLFCNGAIDATVTLTVTNISTGVYKVTGTIPLGYVGGNVLQILVKATVGGSGTGQIIRLGPLDPNERSYAIVAGARVYT